MPQKTPIVGERSMGDARLEYTDMIFAWFDYWMKEDGKNTKPEMPKVKYFTMGKNEWKEAETWPPQGVEMIPFYLNSQGKANSRLGDGELVMKRPGKNQPDTFTYDPMHPVTSYGGNVCCTGNAIQGGAYDQQEMKLREDILVYTSDPLEEGMEVSGFIEATLYLSSDVKDTDLTLKSWMYIRMAQPTTWMRPYSE